MKHKLLLALFLSLPLAAQTKIGLSQLPACPSTVATIGTPVVLVLLNTTGVSSQFTCYALVGATITPGTATTPPTITIASTLASVQLPALVRGEIPAGTVNGVNQTFTLANTPSGSIDLYANGVLQKVGLDYTISGSTITFAGASIPQTGYLLAAGYSY